MRWCFYTDGITGAVDEQHRLYAEQRLMDVILRRHQEPAERIKQAIVDDAKQHIGRQTVYDDLTLAVLEQP